MSIEDFKKKRRAKRLAECQHFTGGQNERCGAGLKYAEVRTSATFPDNFPCHGASPCAKYLPTTPEQVDARECEIEESIKRIGVARAAIVKASGGKRGVHGRIVCPTCGEDTLSYSVAYCNGHIHATCSGGCVAWME